MVPPKDPYIQVRVLEDIGEVSLGDHSVSLTKTSLHFLSRTDAEQFISQVCCLFLCDSYQLWSILFCTWTCFLNYASVNWLSYRMCGACSLQCCCLMEYHPCDAWRDYFQQWKDMSSWVWRDKVHETCTRELLTRHVLYQGASSN